jgi:hypothetical protein
VCAKKAGVTHYVWSTLPDTVAVSGGKFNVPHMTSKARVRRNSVLLLTLKTTIYVNPESNQLATLPLSAQRSGCKSKPVSAG